MNKNEIMEEKYTNYLWDTIADRIGGYLSDSDMSFQDCANRINKFCAEKKIDYFASPQGIHQYLRTGKRETKITPAFISAFAQTFNVSVDWLMGLSETPAVDYEYKSVAKILGVADHMTIIALEKAFNRPYQDKELHKPLLEKLVQSKEFGRMFDGYKQWLWSKSWDYRAMNELDIPYANKKDAADLLTEKDYDLAFAKIMRSALQAVENLNIEEYFEKKRNGEIANDIRIQNQIFQRRRR